MCTKLLIAGTPVPSVPMTLIGAGLQVVGWQMAVIAEFERKRGRHRAGGADGDAARVGGNVAQREPVDRVALVSVTVAVSAKGVLRVTLALVAPVEATLSAILAGGQV